MKRIYICQQAEPLKSEILAAMIRNHVCRCFAWIVICLLAVPIRADDSAAAIAAGGLIARRETRIVMAKEVLQISPTRVVIDYDFRNDTNTDVTTEVAFPVPPYDYEPDGPAISDAAFSDFKLFVDGKRATFQTEARATLNGKDVTATLIADRIDIPSFGHLREPSGMSAEVHTPDVERLRKAEQKRLGQLGLYNADDGWGMWTVHLQYHWTQSFPAHSTVHIRHEYTPVEGFTQVTSTAIDDLLKQLAKGGAMSKEDMDEFKLLRGFCTERTFLSTVARQLSESESEAKTLDEKVYAGVAYPHWVNFILVSANTWRQPIEDFTLVIERGQPLDGYGKPMKDRQRLICFCSPQNAPVEKVDADHFQVRLTNFIPGSDLHIGFFDLGLPGARSASSTAKK